MMDNTVMLKLLLFLSFSLLSSADTHTLQYLYTAVTPGVNFTAAGLVDGEQFVFYDISMTRRISEWMKKAETDDPLYWKKETQHVNDQQDSLKIILSRVMKSFSQSEDKDIKVKKTISVLKKTRLEHIKQHRHLTQHLTRQGVDTLQRIYGCECDDDGTPRGYDEYGYDGEDFISLNLTTGTWTAANDIAKIFINEWDPKGYKAIKGKNLLETYHIPRLQKVLYYSKDTLERKVPPTASVFQKHSSSPEVVCHATGFFPKTVMITWRKDGEDVHEDVDLGETLPNQDGSFQKRSIRTVSAEDLQKHTYTCVIQHSSLEKEIVLPVSERRILNPDGGSGGAPIGIIVGVVAVLVAVVAGIVVWKKKNSGFKPVPPKPASEGDSSYNNS